VFHNVLEGPALFDIQPITCFLMRIPVIYHVMEERACAIASRLGIAKTEDQQLSTTEYNCCGAGAGAGAGACWSSYVVMDGQGCALVWLVPESRVQTAMFGVEDGTKSVWSCLVKPTLYQNTTRRTVGATGGRGGSAAASGLTKFWRAPKLRRLKSVQLGRIVHRNSYIKTALPIRQSLLQTDAIAFLQLS
jgi:hypothetical protein